MLKKLHTYNFADVKIVKVFFFPIFFVFGQGRESNETNFNFELKLRNVYTIGQEDVQLKQVGLVGVLTEELPTHRLDDHALARVRFKALVETESQW